MRYFKVERKEESDVTKLLGSMIDEWIPVEKIVGLIVDSIIQEKSINLSPYVTAKISPNNMDGALGVMYICMSNSYKLIKRIDSVRNKRNDIIHGSKYSLTKKYLNNLINDMQSLIKDMKENEYVLDDGSVIVYSKEDNSIIITNAKSL